MLIVQCLECKYLQNQHFKINNLNLNLNPNLNAVKYFAVHSWAREQPADLVYEGYQIRLKAMRLLWQNITIIRRTGTTPWPSQQQSPLI